MPGLGGLFGNTYSNPSIFNGGDGARLPAARAGGEAKPSTATQAHFEELDWMPIGDLQLPIIPFGLGGPQLTPLPKSQNNVTAANIPSAIKPVGPYDFMDAMTRLTNSIYENQVRAQQAELAKSQVGLTARSGSQCERGRRPGCHASTRRGTGPVAAQERAGTGAAASPDIDSVHGGTTSHIGAHSPQAWQGRRAPVNSTFRYTP